MPLVRPKVHTAIYLSGLMLFAASIPLSNYFMSIAQWILVANFFIDDRLPGKLKRVFTNKAALLVIGIWVLHVIGLLWSHDMAYALKDLRVKLPLLIIPFIFAGEEPINELQLRRILSVHLLAVVAGSLIIAWGIYIQQIPDPRDASFFVSHIRFSLNLCLAFFTAFWYATRLKDMKLTFRLMYGAGALICLVFLFILQSVTGMVVFGVTALVALFKFSLHGKSLRMKLLLLTIPFVITVASVIWLVYFYQKNINVEPIDPQHLEYYTPQGKPYVHNLKSTQKENGNFLWIYICYDELIDSWNKRSTISFDSTDQKGQPINYTLIRFLTSKGLRKDQQGVNSLSDAEIRAIENGIPNVRDMAHPGFMRRLEIILWEVEDYRHTGDPTNHSLMQRVELWKASLLMIRQAPLLGTGTGDVPVAFEQSLRENNSPLQGKGMRSHNQYLAIAVALGFPALIYFLFALFYGPVKKQYFKSYFFFTFFIIALLSMLTEDTLESQPGISFVMFFYGLFLFARNFKTAAPVAGVANPPAPSGNLARDKV